MSIDNFKYYLELPIDLQDEIWKRVLTDFRKEHMKANRRIFYNIPYEVKAQQFYHNMDKCLNIGDADYIQYRAIRDFLQELADKRKIVTVFTGTLCHEVHLSVGTSFIIGQPLTEQPGLLVSCIYQCDIDEPLYGDDYEYVPRSEIPPNEPDKELVFIWVQCGNNELVHKFAINIDRDLIIYNDLN